MNAPISFPDIDAVQRWILESMFSSGSHSSPRSSETLELLSVAFEIDNPRKRLTTNSQRHWNLPIAIGEFAWHVSGSNELDFIAYYVERWREFSDDPTIVRGSSYGNRIFSGDPSRWSQMLRLLKEDPDSRRGVFVLADADQTFDINAKDVACTTSIQFLLRSNKLHAIVTMRSNDVIWGLPYDVFLFTMIQELMALELNVDLGRYIHFAGSLHLYRRHFELGRSMLACPDVTSNTMEPMTAADQLPMFLECERLMRSGRPLALLPQVETLAPYWRALLVPLESLRNRRYPKMA